jgi:hypothetical protein
MENKSNVSFNLIQNTSLYSFNITRQSSHVLTQVSRQSCHVLTQVARQSCHMLTSCVPSGEAYVSAQHPYVQHLGPNKTVNRYLPQTGYTLDIVDIDSVCK